MELNYRLPPVYLKAKLRLIVKEIIKLPDVRLGKHGGRAVFRECLSGEGIRKVREYSACKPEGKILYGQSECRKQLVEMKKQIETVLKSLPETPDIDLSKVKTKYNRNMWENIHVRAEYETKEKGYPYKDMIMDSRGEMIVAQCLDSLGLMYKYEPRLVLFGEEYYPDFIVYLPEFQRCFFIEFMGRLDDDKYIARNEFKLMDYLKSGMVVNRDILLFCGYENSMVNADEMIDDIVALIKKYCRLYTPVAAAA